MRVLQLHHTPRITTEEYLYAPTCVFLFQLGQVRFLHAFAVWCALDGVLYKRFTIVGYKHETYHSPVVSTVLQLSGSADLSLAASSFI